MITNVSWKNTYRALKSAQCLLKSYIVRGKPSCVPAYTVYPKKYAHGFVVLCFVVVKQSLIMNSHEVFIHIHQGCFAGTGAIVRLPQCQWSKPDGYGKISQCITTTKHSKAKTVCIFLGIYCTRRLNNRTSIIPIEYLKRSNFVRKLVWQWVCCISSIYSGGSSAISMGSSST